MMIQNSQMHQVVMNRLAVSALTSFGFGPSPAAAQVRVRDAAWTKRPGDQKGPKNWVKGPFQSCAGERDARVGLWHSLGPIWAQKLGGLHPSHSRLCSLLAFGGSLCWFDSPLPTLSAQIVSRMLGDDLACLGRARTLPVVGAAERRG